MSDENKPGNESIEGVPIALVDRHFAMMMITMKVSSEKHGVPMTELIPKMIGTFGLIPSGTPGEYKLHPKMIQKDGDDAVRISEVKALYSIAWQTAKWEQEGRLDEITEKIKADTEKLTANLTPEERKELQAKGLLDQPDQEQEKDDFDKESNVLSLEFNRKNKNTLH